MSNVVPFPNPPARGRPNLRCACGSEWWEAPVVVDADSREVTGYGPVVCCRHCGEPPPHRPG